MEGIGNVSHVTNDRNICETLMQSPNDVFVGALNEVHFEALYSLEVFPNIQGIYRPIKIKETTFKNTTSVGKKRKFNDISYPGKRMRYEN
jgi:hypothetical protein